MSVDMIHIGGPILWVIVGGGLLAFAVFLERSLYLHRARIRSEDFLKGIFTILRRGNITEALAICEDTPGPIPYLVKTAILHRTDDKADLRQVMDDVGHGEISRMERRLVVVATVAQISPLLGLLGTVLGMVESLLVMQVQTPLIHSADVLDAMMGALVTTGAGLMVAIPCYAAFNLLVVKIDRIVLDMERTASEVVAFLSTEASAPQRESTRDED